MHQSSIQDFQGHDSVSVALIVVIAEANEVVERAGRLHREAGDDAAGEHRRHGDEREPATEAHPRQPVPAATSTAI